MDGIITRSPWMPDLWSHQHWQPKEFSYKREHLLNAFTMVTGTERTFIENESPQEGICRGHENHAHKGFIVDFLSFP